MSRRHRPLSGLLLLLPLGFAPAARATDVLLVLLDDVGRDKLSTYADVYDGGTPPAYLAETPVLDELVSVGLRFTDVMSNPTCSPSRASIHTGKAPHEHDVGWTAGDAPELSLTETTLGDALSGPLAYQTAYIGKWGMGRAATPAFSPSVTGYQDADPNAVEQGYARYVGISDTGDIDYRTWTKASWPAFSAGRAQTYVEERTDYVTEDNFLDAYDFISGASTRRDWFLFFAPLTPHTDPGGASTTGWEEDDLPDGVTCPGCDQYELYQALVESFDTRLGQLLDELYLTDPALLEDTIVIVTGDNGTNREILEGDFPYSSETDRTNAGKGTVYESGIRVPLIVADGCLWVRSQPDSTSTCTPKINSPGRDVDVPASLTDLYPTIVRLGGGVPTSTWGTSLAPCLTRTSADCGVSSFATRVRLSEFFVRPDPLVTTGGAMRGELALRRGDYKLVARQRTVGGRTCLDHEFYNLATDPYEADDLYTLPGRVTSGQANYNALYTALRTLPNESTTGWIPTTRCGG